MESGWRSCSWRAEVEGFLRSWHWQSKHRKTSVSINLPRLSTLEGITQRAVMTCVGRTICDVERGRTGFLYVADEVKWGTGAQITRCQQEGEVAPTNYTHAHTQRLGKFCNAPKTFSGSQASIWIKYDCRKAELLHGLIVCKHNLFANDSVLYTFYAAWYWNIEECVQENKCYLRQYSMCTVHHNNKLYAVFFRHSIGNVHELKIYHRPQ